MTVEDKTIITYTEDDIRKLIKENLFTYGYLAKTISIKIDEKFGDDMHSYLNSIVVECEKVTKG